MKKPIGCLLGLLLWGTAWSQEKWDLRRCVEHAMNNNISVRQQDVQARLARLTLDQSRLAQIPNLNFTSNLGLNSGRSIDRVTNQFTNNTIFFNTFSLQTNVDIFNFFSRQHAIAANRLEAMAQGAFTQKIKNDVALNVATNYLQVLQARQQVQVLRVRQRQTEAQLEVTRKQVKAGALPELNAAQMEAQLAQDSSNIVNAKTLEIQTLFNLKALLALDAAQEFDVLTPPVEVIPVEPLASLEPSSVYTLALQNLPQQQVNSLRLQAAHKNVAASRAAMLPTVSMFGSLQTNISSNKIVPDLASVRPAGVKQVGVVQGTNQAVVTPSFDFDFIANPYSTQFRDNLSKGLGFQINVPIFNGAQARTQWKRAQLNVQSANLQLQLDTLTLKNDIYRAHADAINALEKYNAAVKAVDAAQKAYDFANRRYNVQMLSTIELLNTQTALNRAQLEKVSAQFEYVFRMKLLEFYKGQGLKL